MHDPVPYALKYPAAHEDGSMLWLAARGHASFEGEGDDRKAVAMFGTMTDITEAKTSWDASQGSAAQFRQLVDAMPQIVWSRRADGYIDYYNAQWYELTGSARGKTGNGSWENILHPDDVKMVAEAWSAAAAPINLTSWCIGCGRPRNTITAGFWDARCRSRMRW